MVAKLLLSTLLVAGVLAAFAADKVPLLKAKVIEPVIEDLMGGCSLRCAFPWSVEVQLTPGRRFVSLATLNDESAQSAWLAEEPATGVGAKFRLAFPKKIPAEMDGETPFYGFALINGYWKTEELWAQHARVKKVRLYYNDRPFKDVGFSDSRRWQRVSFDDIMIRSGDALIIEVLELYPGAKAGLALTEFVLEGAH